MNARRTSLAAICLAVFFLAPTRPAHADGVDPLKLLVSARDSAKAGQFRAPLVAMTAFSKRVKGLRIEQFKAALLPKPPKGWKAKREDWNIYDSSSRGERTFVRGKAELTIRFEDHSPGKEVAEANWYLARPERLKDSEKQKIDVANRPWLIQSYESKAYRSDTLTTVLPKPEQDSREAGQHVLVLRASNIPTEEVRKVAATINFEALLRYADEAASFNYHEEKRSPVQLMVQAETDLRAKRYRAAHACIHKAIHKLGAERAAIVRAALPGKAPDGWSWTGGGGGGYPACETVSFRTARGPEARVSLSVTESFASEELINLASLIASAEKLSHSQQIVQLPDRKALLSWSKEFKRWDLEYPIDANTARIGVRGGGAVRAADLTQTFAPLVDVEAVVKALNK